MEERLYKASLTGNVSALNALIQEDQLLLDRASLSLTCSQETPLHIAALRGHLDFTIALLNLKPKLAAELNSSGCSPLHLAAVEGYAEIVRVLLQVDAKVCDVPDLYGRLPLHLAVVKGRVGVVRELIRARLESARQRVDRGETVFHLCVKHYRLEVLKLLVELVEDEELVRSEDDDGNTILHLAAMFKQMETIKYLFSIETGQEMANTLNKSGFTTLDTLEHCPKDLKAIEIRDFLLESGVRRAKDLKTIPPLPPPPSKNKILGSSPSTAGSAPVKNKLKKLWKTYRKSDVHWLQESRGNLMVVATLTATMAFEAGTNPPWSRSDLNDDATTNSAKFTDDHASYLVYNTISLAASLTIILPMMSGFPLQNRFSMWLLMVALCLTITCMALTYLKSLDIITPDDDWSRVDQTYDAAFYTCIGVFGFVLVIYTVRLLTWLVIKLHNKRKQRLMVNKAKENQIVVV